jgi:hypothetical protein
MLAPERGRWNSKELMQYLFLAFAALAVAAFAPLKVTLSLIAEMITAVRG